MTDWAKLFADVEAASKAVREAEDEENYARSKTTSARNALNVAQSAVSKAMHEAKKNSPRDSVWHQETNPSRGFAVAS